LLIDWRRLDTHITDNVVYAAAASGQEAVLRLISERLNLPLPEEKWFSMLDYKMRRRMVIKI